MNGEYHGSAILIGRLHEENGCMSDRLTALRVQRSALGLRSCAGMLCLNTTDLCDVCNLIFQLPCCCFAGLSAALGLNP